mmetsp:Transcript_48572/g.155147  ORF Transcript_48572/g.155147 Transcript_48572/m.155147 type:complete len:219 (+) Transcript_48572:74-730(+)
MALRSVVLAAALGFAVGTSPAPTTQLNHAVSPKEERQALRKAHADKVKALQDRDAEIRLHNIAQRKAQMAAKRDAEKKAEKKQLMKARYLEHHPKLKLELADQKKNQARLRAEAEREAQRKAELEAEEKAKIQRIVDAHAHLKPDVSSSVLVTVVDRFNRETKIRIENTEHFHILMRLAAERLALKPGTVYLYNDAEVLPSDTPSSLGLKDNALIKVQ